MDIEYYMVRVFTPLFYTIEFLLIIIVFISVTILYTKNKDKQSLKVFLVSGIAITLTELFLQGIGTRVVKNAYLFSIPIGFPLTCLLMGFFDGGIKNLFAFHMVKSIKERNISSLKISLALFSMVFIVFAIYNGYTGILNSQGNPNITSSLRFLFPPSSIFLLILSFTFSFSFFFVNKHIPKEDKAIFFYYSFGLIIFMLSWIITAQIFLTRYIGIESIIPAPIRDQMLLMWGYFLLIESVGVSIFIAPILYQLNAFRDGQNHQKF